MSIRVLLVDDQDLVRSGLRLVLQTEPDIEVVGEARDGAEAVRLAVGLRPDVTVMDVRMPLVDGVEATRKLAGPDVADPLPVLVLTTFDDDELVFEALRAGARGFLLKHASPEQLVEAIRVVAAGEGIVAPAVTRRLIEAFAAGGPPPSPPAELDRLSERERVVLGLLARGLTNAEMAAELFVETSTVKTHVGNVLAKLGLRDRIQAVIYAYDMGVVAPGQGGGGLSSGGAGTR
ncbi:response regulator [Euzebya rosea]|uniref:response regulator n=1 Tax=Euzebya rosea TaxID=2052804 RepID=UPI000D3E813C|nr:response regulator transcription factor [Euzebya rosea]